MNELNELAHVVRERNDRTGTSSGVARILFLGGPGQKYAGTRLTN